MAKQKKYSREQCEDVLFKMIKHQWVERAVPLEKIFPFDECGFDYDESDVRNGIRNALDVQFGVKNGKVLVPAVPAFMTYGHPARELIHVDIIANDYATPYVFEPHDMERGTSIYGFSVCHLLGVIPGGYAIAGVRTPHIPYLDMVDAISAFCMHDAAWRMSFALEWEKDPVAVMAACGYSQDDIDTAIEEYKKIPF